MANSEQAPRRYHRARASTPFADGAGRGEEYSETMLPIALSHGFNSEEDYQSPSDSLYQAPYQATSQRSATTQLLRDLEDQREIRESGEVDPAALDAQLNNSRVQGKWGIKSYRQSRGKHQGES